MDIRLFPPEEILETTVALPPSKSIGTRAMVLNFIAGATPEPDDSCDDTATLSAILSAGLPVGGTEVNVGPAGTAMRFLTALFAASEGVDCVLTGSERMLRRPIGPLVGVLRKIGADIEYAGEEGFPPLRIRGRRLAGGSVEIDASVSSQFISALMMITPLLEDDLSIRLLGDVQSMSYIRMTAGMMTQRGACIDFERDKIDISCSGGLKPLPQSEPDWSAAAFWYEISAVTAGWVTLTGISEESLQGDRNVAGLYERLGVLTSFEDGNAELSATPDLYNWLEADLTDMPDAVPSLVATCCLIGMRLRPHRGSYSRDGKTRMYSRDRELRYDPALGRPPCAGRRNTCLRHIQRPPHGHGARACMRFRAWHSHKECRSGVEVVSLFLGAA